MTEPVSDSRLVDNAVCRAHIVLWETTPYTRLTHTRQLVKTQEHQKWFQYMLVSYPIITIHIESPPHIWDDFVGAYIPRAHTTRTHGGFAPTPFEKSQLIQLLLKKENFNSSSSQTLASTC